MLTLHNVTKTYKSKTGQEVAALKSVSFDLPENGLVFIVGKSGSGKSTLLNILGGLDSVTSGGVELNGVGALSEKHVLDAYRNTCLGFVFQEFHLLDTLTVYDNIALALEMKGEAIGKKLIDDALVRVDLGGLTDRYPEELSGGQKQRVAIARAIIKDPKIILADEPTGNLDSTTSKDILQLLADLAKERLVVVVTHDKESAREFGNRIIELKDGEVSNDETLNGYVQKTQGSAPVLRNAKFSFRSVLKFVFSALKHKKSKLVSSIVLSVIAITMFGMAFILSTYDTEKQIAKNMQEAGTKSFIVSPVPNADIKNSSLSDWDIFSVTKAVPSTMYDYMANFYPETEVLGLYRGYWFTVPYTNGLIDSIQYTAVIDSTDDIKNATGLNLLPGFLPLADDSLYLTDAVVYSLANTHAYIETASGAEEISAYFYKGTDGVVHDLTVAVSLSDIVGTQLWERSREAGTDKLIIATIAGIVATDYANLLANYGNMDSYQKAIGEYNGKRLYTLVFCNKQTFLNKVKSTSEYSIDYRQIPGGNSWELPCYDVRIFVGNVQHTQNGLTVRLSDGQNFGQGVPTLGAGEVALTMDFYNSLFGEEVKLQGGSFAPAPQHIGEKITIRVKDVSGRNIATIYDCTVIAVTTNNSFGGDTLYVAQDEFDALFPASVNAEALMMRLSEGTELKAFLKDLRQNGYYVYAPFSLGLYDFEAKFQVFNIIFWGAAGILLLFSVLLIMNFITSGVNVKKKEIGILRALGARISDTEKIFLFESVFIATGIAILSLGLLIAATIVINTGLAAGAMSGTSVLSFNFLSLPIIIVLSYIITALSAALPAYRISKMKPVDAIKKVA
jgi:ABC-type lipoprotein export system ATPase subunit